MTAREGALIALLTGVAVPFGAWFLVGQPMLEGRAAARAAFAEARAEAAWVEGRHAAFVASASAPGSDAAARPDAIGLELVDAMLEEGGLRGAVGLLEEGEREAVRLRLEDAPFEDVGRLLDRLERGSGYAVTTLRIEPLGGAGRVTAALELAPR